MRTTKELLIILDENLHHLRTGLCFLIVNLSYWCDISFEEELRLLEFVQDNKPSRWESWRLFWRPNSPFYWKEGAIRPRHKWLQKHINKL